MNFQKLKVLIGNKKIELQPSDVALNQDLILIVDERQRQLKENERAKIDEDISVTLEKPVGQEHSFVRLNADRLGLRLTFDGKNIAVKVCELCSVQFLFIVSFIAVL